MGGHTDISGNTSTGAAGVSSGVVGIALGVEKQMGSSTVLGLSLGVDHQSLSAGSGGSAHSNNVTLGGYARQNLSDNIYAAAALAYAWHDVQTRRVVTVSGTDTLVGEFSANNLSGRIELGYRSDIGGGATLAPYIAFAADSFSTPAYRETAISGASTFALAYSPTTTDNQHFEAGLHFGQDFALESGKLTLTADAAWAHELTGLPSAQVSFQSLPGSSFVVPGLQLVKDSALLGAGLYMHSSPNLTYGVGVQGQLGDDTSAIAGTLSLVYRL